VVPTWVGLVCILVVLALIGLALVATRGADRAGRQGLTPISPAHERALTATYRDRAVAHQVVAPVSATDPEGDVIIVAYRGHDLHPALVRLHPVGARATQVWSHDLEPVPGMGSIQRLSVERDTIYLERAGTLDAFSVDGEPLWTASGVESCDCQPVFGRYLTEEHNSTLVAYSRVSATPDWTLQLPSLDTRLTTIGDRLLLSYLTTSPRRAELAEVDPRTGLIQWSTDLPCGSAPVVFDDVDLNEGPLIEQVPGSSDAIAAWAGASRCAARVDLDSGSIRWSVSYDVAPVAAAPFKLMPATGRMLVITGLDTAAVDVKTGATTVIQQLVDDPIRPVGVVGSTVILDSNALVSARDVVTGRQLWSTPVSVMSLPDISTQTFVSGGAVSILTSDLDDHTISTRSVDVVSGKLGPSVVRARLAPIPGADVDLVESGRWSQYAFLAPVGGRVTVAPGPWVANLALSGPVDTWTWPTD